MGNKERKSFMATTFITRLIVIMLILSGPASAVSVFIYYSTTDSEVGNFNTSGNQTILLLPNSSSYAAGKGRTVSESVYGSTLSWSNDIYQNIQLNSNELDNLSADDLNFVDYIGTASRDEFIYVNFTKENISSINYASVKIIAEVDGDDEIHLGLINQTTGNYTSVNFTSTTNQYVTLTYNILNQSDKSRYLNLTNNTLKMSVMAWSNGTISTALRVNLIEVTINSPIIYLPNITSWSNNKTNDNSLSFSINTSEEVNFNATANQTITEWHWYKDGVDQSNNIDNFTTSWSNEGNKILKVNAVNSNGTSNTITWNINVKGPILNIYTGKYINVTQISNTINDDTVLQNLGDGEWLLNANLIVNGTENFYINNSDVKWLKINSTGNRYFSIKVISGTLYINNGSTPASISGSTCINCPKITSWNTSTSNVEERTISTKQIGRAYVYADGEGANSGNIIANYVNFSYLGYDDFDSETTYDGIGGNNADIFVLNNSVIINNRFGIRGKLCYNVTIFNNNILYPLEDGIQINHDADAFDATQPTEFGYSKILNNTIISNTSLSGAKMINLDETNYTEVKYNNLSNEGLSYSINFYKASHNVLYYNKILMTNINNIRPAYFIDGPAVRNNYIEGDITDATSSGRSPVIMSNNPFNTYFENITITSRMAPFNVYAFTNLFIKNSTLKNIDGRGMIFNGPSENAYVYNTMINTVNNDGIWIRSAGVKNITIEKTIINTQGEGIDINIEEENVTNKFIDVWYDTLITSSGGRLNYYYNTTFELPIPQYTIWVYLNDRLNDTIASTSYGIKFPILSYIQNSTQQVDYTQKFVINNIVPYANYTIKRNNVVTQTVQANETGFLIFYENINQSDRIIKIEDINQPPAGVTDLQNISYAQNYINWTWTDPQDPDFTKVHIYIDGDWVANVNMGVQYYNATSLIANTQYTINTRTADNLGNINQTWINHTAWTAP